MVSPTVFIDNEEAGRLRYLIPAQIPGPSGAVRALDHRAIKAHPNLDALSKQLISIPGVLTEVVQVNGLVLLTFRLSPTELSWQSAQQQAKLLAWTAAIFVTFGIKGIGVEPTSAADIDRRLREAENSE